MEGFLIKEGGAIKTWKKRWCVLNEGILAYQVKKVPNPQPVQLNSGASTESHDLILVVVVAQP
jgi:hypothetical protein